MNLNAFHTDDRKKLLKYIVPAIVIIIIVLPILMYVNFLKSPASKISRDIEFRVSRGMGSKKIIDGLNRSGLIKNKLFAEIYLKSNDMGKTLKAGMYKFNTNMTPVEIFKMIKERKVDLNFVNFTIPEGFSIKQIADKLYSFGLIKSPDDFIKETETGSFDYDFLKNIPEKRPMRLEDYLFPDTYEFEKGMPVHTMIDEMLKRFSKTYADIKEGASKLGVSPDEIVIMASLIEGEAKVQKDRPLISAVFYNRLKINMKLQCDSTVQYARGKRKDYLYYKDLDVDSLYNTYKYTGLPIGPIDSPGEASLKAAEDPANVNYIYFVAKGDGSHYFTNSYKDFLRYKNSLKK